MQSSESQKSSAPSSRQDVIFRTLLLFGIVSSVAVAVFDVIYLNLALSNKGDWQYTALLIVNTVLTAVAIFTTIFLARTRNVELTISIYILAINIAFTLAILFVSGIGIILAVGAVVFSAVFAFQGLPPRNAQVVLSIAVFFGFVDVVLEYGINLPNRLGIGLPIQQALIIAIGAVTFIFGMHLLSQVEFRSVRTQFNLTFILAIFVPLLTLGIPAIMTTQGILSEKAEASLQSYASQVKSEVETFLQTNLNSIQADALLPSVIGYLKGEETEEEAFGTLLALGSTQQEIKAYLILDENGIVVFDTSESQSHTGINEAAAPYYQNVYITRKPYASDVLFDQNTGEAELYFSAPIMDDANQFLGVLVAEYDAIVLQIIVDESNNSASSSSFAMLIDENHTILANGDNTKVLYKNTLPLTTGNVSFLQAMRRLPPGKAELILTDMSTLEAGLSQPNVTSFKLRLETEDTASDDQASLARLKLKPWSVVSVESSEIFLQPLYAQLRISMFLLLFLLAGGGFVSNLASVSMVTPIKRLTRVAEQVQTGDLTARNESQRQDEFGTLAQAFDQTTSQLAATLVGLEQRVAERTYDLEISRLQSEERSRNLIAISEVSRAISAEQKLDVLLPLITKTVSEKFGFYHAGIFLLDPTQTYAVLQAANSEGGKKMLARGHRLEVGQTGIVGNVAYTGKPRIAMNVGADTAYFNNPDLPDTHSEMALPLNTRGEVIGVLDVQSEKQGAFTDSDVNILGIMADQIAIAIENARLLERTQQALKEVQSMYSQFLRQEWKAFAQLTPKVGYYQSVSGGKLIDKPVQSEEIQRALERGEVIVVDKPESGQPMIVMPVKLRDEVLGVLNILSLQKDRAWAKEEVALIQTASDRLALALENARLLQDSLRRAERERKVSEITSHIRSTNDPNEMIRLAVQELKNALGANRIEVLPQAVTDRPNLK